jgi:hypothetical protein
MRIGEWLSTHPPLARRIVALDPRFGRVRDGARAGTVRAVGIMAAIATATVVISVAGVSRLPALLQRIQAGAEAAEQPQAAEAQAGSTYFPPAFDIAVAQWNTAVERLSSVLTAELSRGRPIPADYRELLALWQAAHPGEGLPIDPFDGANVGYNRTASGYVLWSSGPDQEPYTHDDLVRRFE